MAQKQLTSDQKKSIQKEYESITKFTRTTLSAMASRHGITVDQLLEIINL